jgi:hypothetical protein
VEAAIEVMLAQERQNGETISTSYAKGHRNYRNTISRSSSTTGGGATSTSSTAAAGVPLCHVTYDAAFDDSTYVYRGKNAKPLYDYNTCPFVYTTYYVPPECQQEEEQKNIPALHKWSWMLHAAELGKCRMPPVTPLEAAASYLQQKKTKHQGTSLETRPILPTGKFQDEPGTAVNILWLGLSFLGQPYLSSLCQNYGTRGNGPNISYSVVKKKLANSSHEQKATKNGVYVDSAGRCAPDNREDTRPTMSRTRDLTKDPRYAYPTENLNPDNVEYSGEITDSQGQSKNITVRYCYKYVFNLAKNQNTLYKTLPCGFDWADVDVIFGILSVAEFSKYYIKGTRGNERNLDHVSYISVQTLMNHILPNVNEHIKRENMTQLNLGNVRGKPKSCADKAAGTFNCHICISVMLRIMVFTILRYLILLIMLNIWLCICVILR